jgi:large subunit ribosomal protein L32e
MPKKFLRRITTRYSKLGLRRKNKQVWRKPKGRDNKMRERRRGYPKTVTIGYGTKKSERSTIEGKMPVVVFNVKDLEKVGKNEIAVLGKIGNKNRVEIAKKANEKKIEIYNLNIKKLLRKVSRKENKNKPKTTESKK